jgi:hypothetical protein
MRHEQRGPFSVAPDENHVVVGLERRVRAFANIRAGRRRAQLPLRAANAEFMRRLSPFCEDRPIGGKTVQALYSSIRYYA